MTLMRRSGLTSGTGFDDGRSVRDFAEVIALSGYAAVMMRKRSDSGYGTIRYLIPGGRQSITKLHE